MKTIYNIKNVELENLIDLLDAMYAEASDDDCPELLGDLVENVYEMEDLRHTLMNNKISLEEGFILNNEYFKVAFNKAYSIQKEDYKTMIMQRIDEILPMAFDLLNHEQIVGFGLSLTYEEEPLYWLKGDNLSLFNLTREELHYHIILSFEDEYEAMLGDLSLDSTVVFGRKFTHAEIVKTMMNDTLISYVEEKLTDQRTRLDNNIDGIEIDGLSVEYLGFTFGKEENK